MNLLARLSPTTPPCNRMKFPLLILLGLLTFCGCSRNSDSGAGPVHRPDLSRTNNWVSVGTLDTDDPKRRIDFFDALTSAIHVSAYPEGSPACQVMVPEDGVERVHAFLKTNHFAEPAFHSIWDPTNAPPR
jgi:hypothetical protein